MQEGSNWNEQVEHKESLGHFLTHTDSECNHPVKERDHATNQCCKGNYGQYQNWTVENRRW
jgi:hypothetical protein